MRPPPSPAGVSQSRAGMAAHTAPIPSPIPGGPLPPTYAARSGGPKPIEGAGGNALGIGLAVLLGLLLVGVIAVAVRPVGPAIQEIDPMAGMAPPAPAPAPVAAPTPEPTASPADSELPGVAEMLIEDDEGAENEAREAFARAADEAGLDETPAPPAAVPVPAERVRPAPSERSGRVVPEETPPPTSDELRPGAVVGDDGTRERRAPARKADDDDPSARTPEPTPAPPSVASSVPSLKFLSARQQPLGVPLSLRVRPDGFLANDVSVYYQWRGEGSSGRRKRSLRSEGDGSFALDIPASELRADRLQVWFVAEPGGVATGSASSPIEVKVR